MFVRPIVLKELKHTHRRTHAHRQAELLFVLLTKIQDFLRLSTIISHVQQALLVVAQVILTPFSFRLHGHVSCQTIFH